MMGFRTPSSVERAKWRLPVRSIFTAAKFRYGAKRARGQQTQCDPQLLCTTAAGSAPPATPQPRTTQTGDGGFWKKLLQPASAAPQGTPADGLERQCCGTPDQSPDSSLQHRISENAGTETA